MNLVIQSLTVILPWPLKRLVLKHWFKYQIHPGARIGLSWVFPKELRMEQGARIGHFNVAVNLDRIEMDKASTIGRSNWITAHAKKPDDLHYRHQPDRRTELRIGESSSITKNHHFDCTNRIDIGAFSTIAGYNSQFLTHSINVGDNRQDSAPIQVGDYSFVGTNVVVLGGGKLPSRSILGAKSLLTKRFNEEWVLYGGVPATAIKEVPQSAKYFTRAEGFVY